MLVGVLIIVLVFATLFLRKETIMGIGISTTTIGAALSALQRSKLAEQLRRFGKSLR